MSVLVRRYAWSAPSWSIRREHANQGQLYDGHQPPAPDDQRRPARSPSASTRVMARTGHRAITRLSSSDPYPVPRISRVCRFERIWRFAAPREGTYVYSQRRSRIGRDATWTFVGGESMDRNDGRSLRNPAALAYASGEWWCSRAGSTAACGESRMTCAGSWTPWRCCRLEPAPVS